MEIFEIFEMLKKIILLNFLLLSGSFSHADNWNNEYFGVVTVNYDFSLNGRGKNIDSIAFWEAPEMADTMLFVTAKQNSLVEVWKYPFTDNEQPALFQPLFHLAFFNWRVNGNLVDQDHDLLYISTAGRFPSVYVFKLPQLKLIRRLRKPCWDLKHEPNLALLKTNTGAEKIYVSGKKLIYIHDGGTGKYLGKFAPLKIAEEMVGDSYYQLLYIPDEFDRTGVYVYNPDGSIFKRGGVNRFGDEAIFQSDAEGILIYSHTINREETGDGFIVVSDQIKHRTDFEFFDRRSWVHLGTLRIRGVSQTDGIASTQKTLPDYPLGLFTAVNDDKSVVGVGWDKIFREIRKARYQLNRQTKNHKKEDDK